MSKVIKILAATIATMVMTSAFVGCGGEKDTSSDGEYAKNLIVWDHLTADEHNALDPIIQKWGEDNGVKISFSNDQDDLQGYINAAKSSSGPVLYFGISADNLGTGQKAGYLEEVPEGIIDESKLTESCLSAGKWDGKYYAVPIAQECIALFYNTDKCPEVPETMEELVRLAKDEGLGFEYDITQTYYSYPMLSAQGGYIFKDNGNGFDTSDIGLGNEGTIKGLEFMKSLIDKGLMSADISTDKAREDFKNGNTSFYISGAWDVSAMKEAGVNFKVAPIPTINGENPKPFLGVQTAFVNSQAGEKEKKTAWALLKYLMSNEEVSNILLEKGSRLPVNKSIIESESFKNNELMTGFVKQAEFATPTPNVKEISYVWDPTNNGIKSVLQGKATPKEAAERIVSDIKDQME